MVGVFSLGVELLEKKRGLGVAGLGISGLQELFNLTPRDGTYILLILNTFFGLEKCFYIILA